MSRNPSRALGPVESAAGQAACGDLLKSNGYWFHACVSATQEELQTRRFSAIS
jgi:hypothetical protein